MVINRMWVSSQVPRNSGGPVGAVVKLLRLFEGVEGWKGLEVPWFAARMELAIRATAGEIQIFLMVGFYAPGIERQHKLLFCA